MSLLRVLFVLIYCFVPLAFSQEFGKNKVQYFKNDWQRIQTKHFDIYFIPSGQRIATYAADHIEAIYDRVSELEGHTLNIRVPVILHNSPAHFASTNVIREALPEAVGGFTEIFKNRIVLPFDGSYAAFDHVLEHEMIHAVMFDYFRGEGSGGIGLARNLSKVPLWFSEGLAEFGSLGWEISSEFVLLDATSFGYVSNPASRFEGYMAYKGGQNFLFFIENQYGKGTVRKILRQMQLGQSLEGAFLSICKVELEELGEMWLRELRHIYWPELGTRSFAKKMAKQITDHSKDQSNYNIAPALSPDGKWVAFFSNRGDWEGVYLYDVTQKRIKGRILKAGATGSHESVHPFTTGLGWSPDSKSIAVVSLKEGHNVIHIINALTGKVLTEIDPGVDMILWPTFDKSGQKIYFSATELGQQDLFVWDLKTQKRTQLTFDLASQEQISLSPNGNKVLYSSDEGTLTQIQSRPNERMKRQIFELDLKTLEKKAITSAQIHATNPVWMNDSNFLYLSYESGVSQITVRSIKSTQVQFLTNFLSSTVTPSVSQSAQHLAFSVFEAGGWDVFLMDQPITKLDTTKAAVSYFIQNQNKLDHYFRKFDINNLSTYSDSLAKEKDSLLKVQDSIVAYRDSVKKAENLKENSLKDSSKVIFSKGDTSNQYKNAEGLYIQKPYESEWTLDQASAAAGAAATSGSGVVFGAQAFLTFTDLMGDQEITAMLQGSGGSITDINAYLGYDYLPHRLDFGIFAAHNMFYSRDSSAVNTQNQYLFGDSYTQSVFQDSIRAEVFKKDNNGLVYRDTISRFGCVFQEKNGAQEYGFDFTGEVCSRKDYFRDQVLNLGFSLRYPFSIFSRIQLLNDWSWIERHRMLYSDSKGLVDDPNAPVKTLERIRSRASWTFDNSRFGPTGPMAGGRYQLNATLAPDLGFLSSQNVPEESKNGYYVLDMDFRHYEQFFKEYTIALRASSGYTAGLNNAFHPYQFFVGGDDFTLNYHANPAHLKGTLRERYYSEIETPLRGFDYYDYAGYKKLVLNAEFRFPFIYEAYFQVPPIPFTIPLHYIMGTYFVDYGGAWNEGKAVDNLGLSMGYGIRMNLGVFVLRVTKGWALASVGKAARTGDRVYWSLGAEF